MKTKPFISRSFGALRLALTGCCLVLSLGGFAHDGPEHEIEELTERIKKEGESADLLLQRAIEYQVMGKSAEAAKDLERALVFESDSPNIQRELGRTYFILGKTNEALQTVTRALNLSAEPPEHASLLMVRVEILRARSEHRKALEDAHEAIKTYPGNVEWYLVRSQLQTHLKLTKERIAGLEQGLKETGSGVLEAEWVDALIDDGQHTAALEKIELELKNSRLRSSWLIRRARVRLASGKSDEGKADLKAALVELNTRLKGSSADPSLLADRGFAQELLGDKEAAKKDYEQAKDKGVAEEWLSDRLQSVK